MERSTSALHTDHYELTMVASALKSGIAHHRAVFEVFARRLPTGRAYGVMAGIERVLDSLSRFRFDAVTVDHLVAAGVVQEGEMTDWLAAYRFSGDITGYAEGELFFPYSPVITVTGTFAECVVLETVILSVLNHDCAVASAAARMVDAAGGRLLIEGGSRRTDPESAVAAARAGFVGGFDTTSNLEAGRRHGIPTGGTTAHAFVLAHETEEAAFAAQRDTLGIGSTYLVDTFEVMEGIRRAVAVVGSDIGAVRIDSGDLLGDSIAARELLDGLGATGCRIVVSSDLDEFRVAELEAANAPIDAYLVGTSLVTGSGHPTASMVYKLVAIAPDAESSSKLRAVGKLSPGKRTIGGRKDVHRTVDREGRFTGEVLSVLPVELPDDSMAPQVALVRDGEIVADLTSPAEARARCGERRSRLHDIDRTPWPSHAPAIPTIWEGVEEPLSVPIAQVGGGGA
ncbi:MAG: nicotinate phosphoribosyltransferase [Acidimicrobiales bacterium]|nr:nicotinate phosphoribosyltransferase [Acidimicrobiales bacterium]MDG2218316.1 nicotinate phosphoribosyltransferase [Acidimicrobiales bacterium]